MNKKKIGIIFGKFYPLHIGHVDFIQKASGYVDILYIVVCTDDERDLKLFNESKMKKMPTTKDRIRFVEKTFREQSNIKIIHLAEDGIPPYPNGWVGWSERVEQLLSKNGIKIDMIFTNETQDVENYRKNFIKHMTEKVLNKNFEIKTIDVTRSNFYISATEVRKNPYENWFFIPRHVREFFVLKVAIIGSENSGKTNLTQKLANYYNTTYIKESRKAYLEENLGNNIENLQYNDYSQIVYEHNSQIIENTKIADRILFVDSDFTSLQAFSKINTGIEHPIIEDFIKNSDFDIIIYLEMVDKNGNTISEYDKVLKELLSKHNKKYIKLTHRIDKSKYRLTERYNKSIEIINNYIEDKEMKSW